MTQGLGPRKPAAVLVFVVVLLLEVADVAGGRAVARLEGLGCRSVRSLNPYWDRQRRTFEDPDGYRVVLQNAEWVR